MRRDVCHVVHDAKPTDDKNTVVKNSNNNNTLGTSCRTQYQKPRTSAKTKNKDQPKSNKTDTHNNKHENQHNSQVHGDVKPRNVVRVGQGHEMRLIDFDMSFRIDLAEVGPFVRRRVYC